MLIVPNNWSELQHYKDRSPPWIKLHKKLLDNYEFQSLPVASRALAPMLWLLASEHEKGYIDAAPEKLAFRLRMTETAARDALKPLMDKAFFAVVHDASKPLAEVVRAAMPETEGETETEKRQKEPAAPTGAVALLSLKGIPESLARDFQAIRKAKRAPLTETALSGIEREAQKAGISLEQAIRICCERGWQSFKADWMTDSKQAAHPTQPARAHTDAEETARMLAEKNQGTKPPPAHIRAQIAEALKGKVLQ